MESLELVHEVFGTGCYRPPAELLNRIPTSPRVLDLGANVGAFAVFAFTIWPTCDLVCVEPDPDNLRILNSMRTLNRFDDRMQIIAAAASTDADGVRFIGGLGAGSRVGDGGILTPTVDPIPLLMGCDFAKIDIEGSEWELLLDERLPTIDRLVLVMEYHRRGPADTGAATAATAALTDAGFAVGHLAANHWGHGVLWAWK